MKYLNPDRVQFVCTSCFHPRYVEGLGCFSNSGRPICKLCKEKLDFNVQASENEKKQKRKSPYMAEYKHFLRGEQAR